MTTAIHRAPIAALIAASLLSAADLTDQQKERFLREAEVVSSKELSIGVTLSHRLTLSDGALTHDAHFQDVNEYEPIHQGTAGTEINFHDSYRYNIAAYRLDRLLGLGMTPVSVERKYRGKTGACTWWVDDVLMMELERWKKKIDPPDGEAWNLQMYQARLFNELVYNTDPNLGNLLIDTNWKIWLIDFTRAFRVFKSLREPKNLADAKIDRTVWENLQKLDDATLRKTMGDMLLKHEREALLARRDVIVRMLEERIAREGEAAVLCSEGSPNTVRTSEPPP